MVLISNNGTSPYNTNKFSLLFPIFSSAHNIYAYIIFVQLFSHF